MKKVFYFLMVGFFITAMQISTAQAQDDILTNPCMAVPAGPDRDACNSSMNALSADPLAPPPGAPGMPATGATGMPADPCMAVPAGPDRDACYATTGAPGMPPTGAPGMPPTGAPGMPPGVPGGNDMSGGEEEPPLDDDALEDLFHPPEEDEPDDSPLGDGTEIPPDPADAQ
ncbi:MAG: hypothetical protein CMH74_00810 [Nitrospina sp.]|nr:hypothetical protein [Nitrospina sp.]